MSDVIDAVHVGPMAAAMGDGKAAPQTPEDKARAVLEAAAKSDVLAAGEKAAATLTKANKKTLDAWLAVGAAMIQIDELVRGNKKMIGAIVETLPHFASIPSPIRSNAKWLRQNEDEIRDLMANGYTTRDGKKVSFAADHPTTLREAYRKVEADREGASNGEGEDGEGGEGEGNGEDPNIPNAIAIARNYIDSLNGEQAAGFAMRLASIMAEKPATRKLLLAQMPKVK